MQARSGVDWLAMGVADEEWNGEVSGSEDG